MVREQSLYPQTRQIRDLELALHKQIRQVQYLKNTHRKASHEHEQRILELKNENQNLNDVLWKCIQKGNSTFLKWNEATKLHQELSDKIKRYESGNKPTPHTLAHNRAKTRFNGVS